jgi:hypothetical protein
VYIHLRLLRLFNVSTTKQCLATYLFSKTPVISCQPDKRHASADVKAARGRWQPFPLSGLRETAVSRRTGECATTSRRRPIGSLISKSSATSQRDSISG